MQSLQKAKTNTKPNAIAQKENAAAGGDKNVMADVICRHEEAVARIKRQAKKK